MIEHCTSSRDSKILYSTLETIDTLLLDFDGPVTSIFANRPAYYVAAQLRKILADGGYDELPTEVKKTEDPFEVFSYAATLGTEEARYVEAALRAHEVEAAATTSPTPGSHELIYAWREAGRKLAIVSNNSSDAIRTYIERFDLRAHIDAVSGREATDPNLLKPNKHLVVSAIQALGTQAQRCTLLGDSSSDMTAAQSAGVVPIGYANKAGKSDTLRIAGARTVVKTMTEAIHLLLSRGST